MTLEFRFFLTMLYLFPVVVGAYQYNRITAKFHGFVYMMWLEMGAEIVSYFSKTVAGASFLHYATLPVYYLLSFYYFLQLAVNFSYVSPAKKRIFLVLALIIGCIDAARNRLTDNLYYLHFFVSIVQLVVAIDILSGQILTLNQKMTRNFWFWMSSGAILFNAMSLLVFCLYYFTFKIKGLGNISTINNVLYYLCSGVAICCIPPRKLPGNNPIVPDKPIHYLP